jgi:molybdopterin-guanine dinucleotide biosynthesis protein A
MGQPKAWLPFGGEPLLARVVRSVELVVEFVVVVAAQTQDLPPLPESVRVVRDRRSDSGPLEGLSTALSALDGQADVVFVCGCDMPLVMAAVVEFVLHEIEDHDAAVPRVGGLYQPLCAAYRPTVAAEVEKMIANGDLRMTSLMGRIRTRTIEPDELRAIDPDLRSLRSCNTPEEYRALLEVAGL